LVVIICIREREREREDGSKLLDDTGQCVVWRGSP